MWTELAAAVLLLLLFLYVPGYLLLRGLGRTRWEAIALAPPFAIVGYSILAVVYAQAGVDSTWVTLSAPLVIVGLAIFVVGWVRSSSGRAVRLRADGDVRSFAAYLVAGIAGALFLYVIPLGAPDAFVCGNDYAHHLNVVRSFVDSGNWSTLDVTAFPGQAGAYYPSANSAIPALAVSCIGVSVPIALNATNIVMVGFMFPLGMWAFMIRLYDKRDPRLYVGALCCMIVLAFPWEFFRRSVLLYANELGLALMPAFMALLMDCFIKDGPAIAGNDLIGARSTGGLARRVVAAAVALAAIALAHPSAFFSAAVFAGAYICYAISQSRHLRRARRSAIAVCGWVAVCLAIWALLMLAPFLQDVVDYPYEPGCDGLMGILRIFSLWSPFVGAQYVLGLVAIIGIVAAVRDKRHRWILIPYIIAAVLAYCCMVLPPSSLKGFLSGFWYNHAPRLIATMAVFAVPVIVQGIGALMRAAAEALGSRNASAQVQGDGGSSFERQADLGQRGSRDVSGKWAQAIVVCVIGAAVAFVPLPFIDAATLWDYASMMKDSNDPNFKTSFLTGDERAFLERAAQITNGGGMVVNAPHDGSGFAYGLYGQDTMVRSFYPVTDPDEVMLAHSIDKIAVDAQVAEAAERLGAEYVIRLDDWFGANGGEPAPDLSAHPEAGAGAPSAPPKAQDGLDQNGSEPAGGTMYGIRFDAADWQGIFSIADDTPGFEVVLSEGDMRLYRIVR